MPNEYMNNNVTDDSEDLSSSGRRLMVPYPQRDVDNFTLKDNYVPLSIAQKRIPPAPPISKPSLPEPYVAFQGTVTSSMIYQNGNIKEHYREHIKNNKNNKNNNFLVQHELQRQKRDTFEVKRPELHVVDVNNINSDENNGSTKKNINKTYKGAKKLDPPRKMTVPSNINIIKENKLSAKDLDKNGKRKETERSSPSSSNETSNKVSSDNPDKNANDLETCKSANLYIEQRQLLNDADGNKIFARYNTFEAYFIKLSLRINVLIDKWFPTLSTHSKLIKFVLLIFIIFQINRILEHLGDIVRSFCVNIRTNEHNNNIVTGIRNSENK
ncbi:uncharacterized protein SCDLUD_000950 [Saccharomycodes ludwigii]|uniref:uncharacterized protein n=1 Tax=Saccharomycodes ludwigii TaxID=36035 RepID=UPI001E87C6A5|nr:hypothetical protein SCDLUD_000950 [Saccharomycodes ludwigii]KAH3903324.1 hypothetical protein SCDLUD_000950 [Saccharomycodes ludwigii]